ncbi:hypothetical protein SGFS_040720 [Streptomyces graminofaciens]|uniref:Secreted protein n=1 Tax=Streptomyces graminofaciens TaxID=68212 RepID=A0ABN5VID2_9ACTN|nr:hypothetical protein [Streptomyces graminofaciens]BBC32778.1 hypothetical protein SGFS_040720 [Streptomyces graminofaciens]
MKKLIAGAMTTVAVGAMVPLLVAAPASADAQAKVCTPGSTKISWPSAAKRQILTHGVARNASAPGTVTVGLRMVARVWANVSGPAQPSAVIASLGKQTGTKLAPNKKATPGTLSATAKITPGKTIFYAGTTKASGKYEARTCNSKGTGYGTAKKGQAVSWTKLTKGAINCKTKVVNNPLASAAQAKFC